MTTGPQEEPCERLVTSVNTLVNVERLFVRCHLLAGVLLVDWLAGRTRLLVAMQDSCAVVYYCRRRPVKLNTWKRGCPSVVCPSHVHNSPLLAG